MEKKYLRALDKVLLSQTVLSSGNALCLGIEGSERRKAIVEVLLRIPDEDYEILEEAFKYDFEWFIPDYHTGGFVRPSYATIYPEDEKYSPYNVIVYLSPILEKLEWDIVVAVVAHELAHIVLGHKPIADPSEYDTQEEEAFSCLCEWGFEKEADKNRAISKGLKTTGNTKTGIAARTL